MAAFAIYVRRFFHRFALRAAIFLPGCDGAGTVGMCTFVGTHTFSFPCLYVLAQQKSGGRIPRRPTVSNQPDRKPRRHAEPIGEATEFAR
jgi:hypothetical protein